MLARCFDRAHREAGRILQVVETELERVARHGAWNGDSHTVILASIAFVRLYSLRIMLSPFTHIADNIAELVVANHDDDSDV